MSLNENNLTIVVPCYNEYQRFPTPTFKHYISSNPAILFCFVNDGSTDDTLSILNELKNLSPENVLILPLSYNVGKAEAIRFAVNHNKGEKRSAYIAFLDADLSTPIGELLRVFSIMKKQNLLLAFGSRVFVFGSNIKRVALRHYFGRVMATMTSLILDLAIYDTQCGIKIFKSDLADQLFFKKFISRWLFDVEIFARIKMLYGADQLTGIMKEVPLIEWIEKGDSRIKFVDVIKVPYLLMKIKVAYRKNGRHWPKS
ncbi:glycosyl transferase family 2 [Pedobacter sp. KBW06]|uniref:glycosyltransferase n=1 Tax=Pedobacter sp. KBW06 TaxID=2153359 RepID=UPI000F59107D|nr:glycosyltransferase [Pedobacter sp. KBW06]RQO66469.1 glycosyl transferase family 2 [Pedobacter sp. KBW06]